MKKTTNKIGIIHYTAPPVIGGAEEVIRFHTDLFLKDNLQVRIIVGEGGKFNDGIELAIIQELKADLKRKFDPELSKKLEKKLYKVVYDLDLIIIHNMLTMPFNLEATVAIANLAKQISTVAWVHDLARFDPNYPFPTEDFPWSLLINRIPDITYVAISEYRKKQLSKLFDSVNDVHIIPNGIDIFSLAGCDQELTTILEPVIEKGTIGFTPGRLVRRKNFELAIEITYEINKIIPFVLLITAPIDPHNPATKEYHRELKTLVKRRSLDDRVIFLSERINLDNWDRIRALYILSDLLLLTSKIEGFGLPIIESTILKTPIFSSDIPPIRSLVGAKESFFFSLAAKPSQIANNIVETLSKSESYNLRKKIIDDYRWQTIYKKRIKPLIVETINARK